MNKIDYIHKMAAHCESGVVTSLLNHNGVDISEPLIFGISGGMFFGYIKSPMLSFPIIALRSMPGRIINKAEKRLGVSFKKKKYSNPVKAQIELDAMVDNKILTGVQADFFYMDYVPDYLRVHINVHYILVVGRNENKYLVSDSYHPELAELKKESLNKGRFAKGMMPPKGLLFYVDKVPEKIDFEKAIIKGIKGTTFDMLKIPLPFLGVNGIKHFGKKVLDWPKLSRDVDQLSHEIMKIHLLLEEQGTGGGGFRFIYATFLRQASEIVKEPRLFDMSKKMMSIGDDWRNISIFVARIGKNRDLGPDKIKELSNMILAHYELEKEFFTELRAIVK